jgi:hypothetical protein
VLYLDRFGTGQLRYGERPLPGPPRHQPHLLICDLDLYPDRANSREHLAGHVVAWRGLGEHVSVGERRYFLDLSEVGRHIREHVAWASEGGSLTGGVAPENIPSSSEG